VTVLKYVTPRATGPGQSYAGYPTIPDYGDKRMVTPLVPGSSARILGGVVAWAAPLFLAFIADLHVSVATVRSPIWGYTRKMAASDPSKVSCHYSATAVDVWPDGIGAHTWPARMSAAQARNVVKLLDTYREADGRLLFRWLAHESLGGAVHRTSSNDPMHFELSSGLNPARVRAAMEHLRIGPDGIHRPARTPSPHIAHLLHLARKQPSKLTAAQRRELAVWRAGA